MMPIVEQPPHPAGVMAAPNIARLIIRLSKIYQDNELKQKWHLGFEIIDAVSLNGPLFARQNQIAKGFSFESCDNLSIGDKFSTQAEYIGGARRGMYHLKTLIRVE